MESPVSVFVRVRPLFPEEVLIQNRSQYRQSVSKDSSRFSGHGLEGSTEVMDNANGLNTTPPDSTVSVIAKQLLHLRPISQGPPHTRSSRHRARTFAFDRVFGPDTTQDNVYADTTAPLLDNVLEGRNATVFAYGATGCGKSHTVSGLMQRSANDLWERMALLGPDHEVQVTVEYLQIYNEAIYDLIPETGDDSTPTSLELRQGPGEMIVKGLSQHNVHSSAEMLALVDRGNRSRTVAATHANALSSRSHAVLMVHVDVRDLGGGTVDTSRRATLSIIDLAGSERAAASHNRGERLREGARINRSLLALGKCICRLSDPRLRAGHIPYRDSKLTRLLQFSLGGNCRTAMIVCVSPAAAHYEETLNTLFYGNRAKRISTVVSRNETHSRVRVSDLESRIHEHERVIADLQTRLARQPADICQALLQNIQSRIPSDAVYMDIDPIQVDVMSQQEAVDRVVCALSTWLPFQDSAGSRTSKRYSPTKPPHIASDSKRTRVSA